MPDKILLSIFGLQFENTIILIKINALEFV